MKHTNSQKHQFSLYVPGLSSLTAGLSKDQLFTLADPDLVHRIMVILRLAIGESLLIFDQKVQVMVIINAAQKNKLIQLKIESKKSNQVFQPDIVFLLPLLKKESLEAALYSLTEIGVSKIHLAITQKSQQRWTPKEQERAQKIIIAAAEQSKNFAFPQLFSPLALDELCAQLEPASFKIFFDPAGRRLSECLELVQHAPKQITLAIGPEGDLTEEEKELMHRRGFTFCALTPTVLRACQAAALSTGIFRSIIS